MALVGDLRLSFRRDCQCEIQFGVVSEGASYRDTLEKSTEGEK